MSRKESVRQAALERDGRRCQITGAGGPEWQGVCDVAHWQALGMGGSDELDTIDNVLTISSVIHRTYLHPGVSVPTMRIVHWDPNDLENGLVVEQREFAYSEWVPYPKWSLWFYRKGFVEHVKENLGNMHAIQTLTGYHAMTIFELRLVWEDLYEDAASFDQVVSSLGWDPESANDLADKHVWLLDHKCQWPEGLTSAQLTEIIDREAPMTLFDDDVDSMQSFLNTSAEKSLSDLKKAMIAKGLRIAQPFYYVVMSSLSLPVVQKESPEERWAKMSAYNLSCDMSEDEITKGIAGIRNLMTPITIIQSRDEQGMKAAIRNGEICQDIEYPVVFRMGKAVMNLTSVKNSLRLKDDEKTKIKVIQWPLPKKEDDDE